MWRSHGVQGRSLVESFRCMAKELTKKNLLGLSHAPHSYQLGEGMKRDDAVTNRYLRCIPLGEVDAGTDSR